MGELQRRGMGELPRRGQGELPRRGMGELPRRGQGELHDNCSVIWNGNKSQPLRDCSNTSLQAKNRVFRQSQHLIH